MSHKLLILIKPEEFLGVAAAFLKVSFRPNFSLSEMQVIND